MAHRYGTNPGMICRESEEDELLADVMRAERRRDWEGNCKCGEPLRADGGCQLCDEDRAKEIPFACGALFTILLLCIPAFGQAAGSGPWLYSGPAVYGALAGAPAFYAALPQVWVDNNELTCGLTGNCYTGSPGLSLTPPAYTLTLGGGTYGGTSGTWSPSAPCGLTTLTRYSGNYIGLWNAVNDVEGCRTSSGAGTLILGPPGAYAAPATGTGSGGLTIPQTNTVAAASPIIVRSTAHFTLAGMSQPLCRGGLQKNLAISTNPGMNNSDCTGTNMYFELGPTNSSGNILGITTVSVNTTGVVSITANASAQVLPLANGFVSPTLAPNGATGTPGPTNCPSGEIQVDTGSSAECVTPIANGNTALAGTGSMTSGSAILTDSSNPFTPGMVGLPITVSDAGSAGGTATLSSSVYSYQNDGQVTLVDTAKASVTGQTITMGGNQIGLYGVFANSHTAPFCVLYNVTAADVALTGNSACIGQTNGTGAFTFANGTATNVSAYNYAQYMILLTSQATDSYPLVLCSPVSSLSAALCGNGPTYGEVPNQYIGPDHWEFDDFAPSLPIGSTHDQFLVETGPNTPANATPPSGVPSCTVQPFAASCYVNYAHNIHFNGIWPHGDWTSLYTGANAVADGIDLSGCYYCSVTNFQISQAIRPSAEGHCIYAQGNTLKIDNGVCEGESSGIFAGGESYNSPWLNYIGNTDVEIRRVDEGFRYDWLGMVNIPASNPNYTTGKYTYYRKNCHEFKEGARILYDGIWCGDVDNTGEQNGILVSDGTRNISGSNPAINYNNFTSDFTAQNIFLHDSCNGFVDLGGRSHSTSDGQGATWAPQRFSYSNILGWGISETNPDCNTGKNYGLTSDSGNQTWNATISCDGANCTVNAIASVDAGVAITGATYPSAASGAGYTDYATSGNTAAQNAALCGGTTGEDIFVYGFTSSYAADNSTTSGFPCVASSGTFITLTNVGTTATGQTAFANPILAATAASQNAAVGFQVLDIRAGEPIAIAATIPGTTCTGFAPSSGTQTEPGEYIVTNGIGPSASTGSAAWLGSYSLWTQSMASVQYSSTSTSSDTSGLCLIGNVQGGTEYATINHVGLITDAYRPIDALNTPEASGPTFTINHALLNSYFFTYAGRGAGQGGWIDIELNSPAEGTNTEELNYDPNTLTTYGLVFPGRTASEYTEFKNNPNYTEGGSGWIGNTCSGTITLPNGSTVNGCSAPANSYFPTNTCGMGFQGTGSSWAYGGCSGNAVPLTAPDYHMFELQSGSTYSATGANPSPDGSGDIGPNIPAIDGALLQNQYVCATPCGSPGPFPD